MSIPLARRTTGSPIATDDEVHDMLIADQTITQFQSTSTTSTATYPQINAYGINNTSQINSQPILTSASSTNAASNADVLVKADEHWVNKHWRPAMGWLYMVTCAFDFVLFPVLWSMLQSHQHGTVTLQWQPLTLQGAGLYHLAMGAVLGVAAYGRTKEKMSGTN